MRISLIFLLLLSACSKHGSKSTASGITGLDSGAEINRITGHLSSSAKLPRSGENLVRNDTFSSTASGARCRYTKTSASQIGNVTADSLDQTDTASYAIIQGDSCPPVPKGMSGGSSTTSLKNADYIAARKAELKAYLDFPARMQAQPLIRAIGISNSEATSVVISGHSVPVQRITVDIVNTNGITFQEVHDFATESWFLGRVTETLNVSGQSNVVSQVTTYNP